MERYRLDSGLFLDADAANGGDSQNDDSNSSQAAVNDNATAIDYDRITESVVAKLQPILQSEKDRGVANANKNSKEALDEISQIKALLEAKGVLSKDVESVLAQHQEQQEYAQLRNTVAELVKQKGEASPATPANIDYEKVLREAGYDLAKISGMDYVTLQREIDASGENAIEALRSLREESAKQISGSGISQPPSKKTPPPDKIAELNNEYKKEKQKLIDSGRMNPQNLARIKQEYRKKGLSDLW